jgi:TRAP-type C4-dicarboxylate transport system permease small subunit
VEKGYALWRGFQDKVLGPVAGFVLVACTLLALLEVVRRYLFGVSFEWQQDAVTFFIVSAVFLYFAISQRHNEHLNVTVLLEVLNASGPRGRKAIAVIKLIALVISLIFMCLSVWWGIPEVEDAIKYKTTTESLVFPMWPFLAALLLSFAFMALTLLFQTWFAIQKLRGRKVPEEERIEDRMRD